MWDINEFAAITIRMASPERIREWSRGEVKKPETINYRTLKPELEGLFCEKIFGCTKDWECYCGKYKGIRYKSVVCDRCQVEVTHSKVRRERMGSIELVAPVSHIWYFKGIPSRMGIILGMTVRDLERVLYFQDYIVVDPGATPLKEKQLLDEDGFREAKEKYGDEFKAGMGAEAVRELLRKIDVNDLARDLREDLKTKPSKQEEKQIIRRLSVVESFSRSGNHPDWMVMDVLPVIPPELRPMVQLDGGRFATSDLNDLYRRVINRNNRLKRLLDLKAPQIIVRNEKRMLQEAVDALFDNGRRGRSVKGSSSNRILKSLSDMLKGKQGRFRQNLLGKRVDYSGRSVIVVGPELKIHQCGLPKVMALELFKPFLMRELVRRGLATNIKSAKRAVERGAKEVYEVVEDVIQDHPVMLNRAPTLHRLGIQAFEPVLIEGKSIKVHPLVCVAFNADFDGDQMAVHVPLSAEAVTEAKVLMLSSHNLLSPANGKPIVSPTQDIVLGMYYLTRERESRAAVERIYADPDEALRAMEAGVIHLQSRVRVRLPKEKGGKIVETTPGRLIFNEVLPAGFEYEGERYVNRTMTKAEVVRVLDRIYRRFGMTTTARVADSVKDLGFRYATFSGLSIGADDMRVPAQKDQIIELALRDVEAIQDQFKRAIITEDEKYTKVIDLWTHVTDEVARVMFDELESDADGFNPVYVMADSGARGSKAQIKQLAGMRGLMADPFGKIRETPIVENFREGLSVISFFQSTNGSRKGLTDTALKTANAGYLTRRLVDVAQDVVVTIRDCGTANGLAVQAIRSGEDVYEPLRARVLGRVAAETAIDPRSGRPICEPGTEIDEKVADAIHEAGIEEMRIRSVLTCTAERGVCQMCYGRDLATGRIAEIGEAVGVIAGQSIGEPGTQLTLRTFHVGGTASSEDTFVRARFTGTITSLPRVKKQEDGSEIVTEQAFVKGRRIERLEVVPGTTITHVTSRGTRQGQPLRRGVEARVLVKDGETVPQGQNLVEVVVKSREGGKVKLVRRDSVVIHAGGRKDHKVEIPAGLRATVTEGEKIEGHAVVARRGFPAPFAGAVEVKETKGGTRLVLHAAAEESLSALAEKSKFIEAEVLPGAELRVAAGDVVDVGGILGVNASYKPMIASMTGRLDFERFRVQAEGNENVVVKPEDQESEEPASVVVWDGAEVVVDGALEVQPGQEVKEGQKLGGGVAAPCAGTLHVVRRYLRRTGGEGFSVVRIDRRHQKEMVPYLRYTKTSAGAARSKTLSKIKKQNIRLISKAHVVAIDPWKAWERAERAWRETLSEARISPVKIEGHGDVFGYEEFACADQHRLDEARKAEERRTAAEAKVRIETGDLLIKLFSDFLRGPKEGGAEKKGMTKDITGGLPRVEELFEIRKPKATPAILAPVDGTVSLGTKWRKSRIATLKGEGDVELEVVIPPDRHLYSEEGDEVTAGQAMTDGPVDPHELLKVKGELDVTQYIVDEVQEVYRLQGVDIHDKHIEVIVRQMLRKVQIEEPGDTEFLPDELVDKGRFEAENRRVIEAGRRPAKCRNILLGITKAAKLSDSFISAASFQETTWALTDAAIRGKRDDLRGLKENVIIGHLIPAGTGIRRYRDVRLLTPEPRPILGPAPAPEVEAAVDEPAATPIVVAGGGA